MAKVISEAEHQERFALYEAGMNDCQIAKAIGRTSQSIKIWRDHRSLPANGPRPIRCGVILEREVEARRHLLYQLGWSDHGIARELGLGVTTCRKWRIRRNLPLNFQSSVNQRFRKVAKLEDVFARVRRAIGRALPRDIADDAVMDMIRDLLDGTIPLAEIEAAARRYGNRVLDKFASRYGPRSLDQEIGDSDGFTLLDRLADDSQSSWLEEMGATVW